MGILTPQPDGRSPRKSLEERQLAMKARLKGKHPSPDVRKVQQGKGGRLVPQALTSEWGRKGGYAKAQKRREARAERLKQTLGR
jgi:hypothetical protein